MGMVPPVPVAMGARMPMMANGISPMVSAAGYIGRYCMCTLLFHVLYLP